MTRQDRKDNRFHAIRAYSEARDVACQQIQIPYRRRGRSWDIEDGQSQFAHCSAEVAAKAVPASARLSLKPADAQAVEMAKRGRGFLDSQRARDEAARAGEIALSLSLRDRRLADDARDCRVR